MRVGRSLLESAFDSGRQVRQGEDSLLFKKSWPSFLTSNWCNSMCHLQSLSSGPTNQIQTTKELPYPTCCILVSRGQPCPERILALSSTLVSRGQPCPERWPLKSRRVGPKYQGVRFTAFLHPHLNPALPCLGLCFVQPADQQKPSS
eukprot:1156535-Pelagomonas_calceolata.AAC.10